ncbi:MAG: dipeptide epimerase [Candidatus Sumerlaeaceae bacterium]|nr:dipeptide epimerase [Candidatus Sumerlaeaceae bacterium]
MKIRTYRLQFRDPFGISRSTGLHCDNVFVELDGGWGEAAPTAYMRESRKTAENALKRIGVLDLPDLDCVEEVEAFVRRRVKGHPSARAAFDIALYDRLGRRLGIPLWKLFGRRPRPDMTTSFTIGIDTPEVMMRKVDAANTFDILKIKLGRDIGHDLSIMRAIRRKVGSRRRLLADANGGWTLAEARRALPVLADLGVEFIEQPLPRGAHEEVRRLRKTAPLPIILDEDSVTAADLPALVGVADGINIKLMKSGGLTEARRMVAVARTLGFSVMIGCMIESSVAITAAAHLAPFADYIDLDGNLLVTNDPFEGVRSDPRGRLTLQDLPGLGLRLRPEYSTIFA